MHTEDIPDPNEPEPPDAGVGGKDRPRNEDEYKVDEQLRIAIQRRADAELAYARQLDDNNKLKAAMEQKNKQIAENAVPSAPAPVVHQEPVSSALLDENDALRAELADARAALSDANVRMIILFVLTTLLMIATVYFVVTFVSDNNELRAKIQHLEGR